MAAFWRIVMIFIVVALDKQVAYAIKCLSCQGVLQPRYCTTVRQCPDHDTCGMQQYTTISGETRFDVGCVTSDFCNPTSSDKTGRSSKQTIDTGSIVNIECEDCCHGDLCNSRGCGQPGYPTVRGPMCYNCQQESHPTKCEQITFCRSDELCGTFVHEFFGDQFYSSRCVSKYDCALMVHAPSAIGRRQLHTKPCSSCCETDLCNDNCQTNATTTTTTASPTTHSYSYRGSSMAYEFIMMFMESYSHSGTLQALISSQNSGYLEVEIPVQNSYQNISLSHGFNYLNFTTYKVMGGRETEVEHKGIYLKSSTPISVFGLNHWYGSAEGYLTLPVNVLGTEYIVVSYGPNQETSNFMLVAAENDTEVTITFRIKGSGGVLISGKDYTSGMVYNLTLQRLESLQASHKYDLTGTRIVSNKPVAAVSGTKCSMVLYHYGDCQPLQQYLIPMKNWGSEFVVPDLPPSRENIIRIIPAKATTSVVITDYNGKATRYNVTGSTGYSVKNLALPLHIQSDSPVQVSLLTANARDMEPTMLSIPSINNYDTKYSIAVPKIGKYNSSVIVVSKTHEQVGVRINGNALDLHVNRNSTVLNGTYTVRHLHLDENSAFLDNFNDQKFGVFVYGISYLNSYPLAYSYPGGMRF